mmetsp:Transcript_27344/g.36579  ORF Transcript_27344/g.36579 Transcript_27344/m.36579 type:complete len:98 (-) Transcript_27344:1581-1874(-)|eukprot:CAMPEP_0185571090 /NCGR_PEP_ID=MMETSP0434-20130131/3142_1 /TAXON_ID=626734 ORGANISM="Favella taraikaensis, Strain Fe Narragansett Bay" /NCGR_SAMPLE_ID=MMETSP0434 /ASSEMBLY_ACC=CAM_ASM_000379 /LENGTH=97 /DNA_ID=CAMNT_0028186339 /DNA_START=84 /DNA_END=377 /DNA_ORIENTATION=-
MAANQGLSRHGKSYQGLSLNRIDMITESFNGSSIGLNGTSIEDIKELTLNMKVPASFSRKTKTEAEAGSTQPASIQPLARQVTIESLAGQGPTFDDH